MFNHTHMSSTNTVFHNIKIIFWNCRSFKPKKNEILTIIENYDIMIQVESWLKASDKLKVPGFTVFRKDRTLTEDKKRGGGILILVSSCFNFVSNSVNTPGSSVEIFGLRISDIKPSFQILVCYRAPKKALSQCQWDQIFSNANLDKNTLFVGDFNAYNKFWNCAENYSNGVHMMDSVDSTDLYIYN